jgi:hypothetical protein
VSLLRDAADDPDPWRGLCGFLERSLELQSENCALSDLVLNTPEGLGRVMQIRSRLMPLGTRLVERARESGRLRPDFAPQDLPMLQLMLRPLLYGARDVEPELWRRYLPILLQGLLADPAPPAPLEQPPLAFDQIDVVMSAAKR